MTDIRREVKEEIDRMSDDEVRALQKYMDAYPDPIAAACRNAPWDDEPVTEEELRSIREDEEWSEQNGGRAITHEASLSAK